MVEKTRAELARREKELLSSHRLLDAITEIQSLFIRDAEPRQLFEAMTATLLRVTDSAQGFVAEVLRDADGGLGLRALSPVCAVWEGCARQLDEQLVGLLDGLFDKALQHGEAVIGSATLRPGIESCLGMPVHAGGVMVGMIGLANRPGGYDEALLDYLKPLARSCGQIIEAFRSDRERVDALAMSSAILQGAGHALISTDLQGRIRTFNPAAERLLGYTATEVVGRRTPGAFHDVAEVESRAQALTAELGRAVVPGIEVFAHAALRDVDEREWTYRHKDGSRIPVWLSVTALRNAAGQATGYLGIASDLRERQQTQAQLQRLTSGLRAVVNLSPDGFVSFDEHGLLSFVNPAFLSMCGCTEQALSGKSEADFDSMLATMCDAGKPYTPLALLDDGEGDVLSRTQPRFTAARRRVRRLHDDQGRYLGRVVYFHDITRESEIDRMKTEFLSTAAHELRTPMASIHGFSELLLKREFDPETRRDLIQTIHRQSSNLVVLVNELLDLARIGARAGKDFRMKLQPVLPIIDATVRHLLVPGDPRSVTLRLASALPAVHVDADKLEQALLNVLVNAYKYSPQGGAIELSTCQRERGGQPEVGIAVRDHGIGMTPEQAARIFERFYRADESGAIPGTGLGMSLVHEIMQIHGGMVEIDTRLGAGMEVTLWLPAAASVSGGVVSRPERDGS
jgi:PAS domain S-box-containing protein